MSDPELALRPTVRKTFVKGLIAIGIFSIFLEVNVSNLTNYLIFVTISIILVLGYMGIKHSSRYVIGVGGISISPFFRAQKTIPYSEIVEMSIAQGFLAKRFSCGTIFLQLGSRRGSYISFGGGAAEVLRDVDDPKAVYDRISSNLSPY